MEITPIRHKADKLQEILHSRDQLVLEITGAKQADLYRLFKALNHDYSIDLKDQDILFLSHNPDYIFDNFELSDEQIKMISGGKGSQKNVTIDASTLNGKTTYLSSHCHYTIRGDLVNATVNSPDSSFSCTGNMHNSHINTR